MNPIIHHGDCLDIMATMPENSVDAIVTDPPYGLGFMGRKWDALPPGKEWAEQCLRVLKPGGHLLAFGGTRTWHRLAVAIEDAGLEIRDSIYWHYGSGFPKSHNLKGEWEGWGTALKPAAEPIVMARKPFKGTLAANVLEHGTGAINVDACRIGYDPDTLAKKEAWHDKYGGRQYAPNQIYGEGLGGPIARPNPSGRWPANVILDEEMAGVLDQMSGETSYNKAGVYGVAKRNSGAVYGGGKGLPHEGQGVFGYGDKGGASRFFHVIEQDAPFIYCAKAPKKERPQVDGISHPTTKPLRLMRLLVRMVTPPGGTVLDPFAGSGTTIEAAMLEGFDCIGIEREAEYLPLIHERIRRATEQLRTEQEAQAEAPDQGAFPLEDIA